jgi:hypothetical protein
MAKELNITTFAAVVDNTPSPLRLSAHDKTLAEPIPSDFRGIVRAALKLQDRGDVIKQALAGHFAGRSADEVRELLLPEVAAYYGLGLKKFKKGGTALASAPEDASIPKGDYAARYTRARQALLRLMNVIVGEQAEHNEKVATKATKKAPSKATEATEGEEGDDTPEDAPEAPKVSQKAKKALADVIATYGLTRKQALVAIAEIFANQK